MRSARSLACIAVVAAAAAVPSGAAASAPTQRPAAAPAADRPTPSAGRPATPAEAGLITAAVHSSPLVAGVPAGAYTVTDIRLSASTPGWAYARVVPQGAAELNPSYVVLSRRATAWSLGEIGSVFVGCGKAPASVLKEFTVTCR